MTADRVISTSRANQAIKPPISFTDGSYGVSIVASGYSTGNAMATMMLPLPNQIADAYNVSIATTQLGFLGGLARDLGETGLSKIRDLIDQFGKDVIPDASGGTGTQSVPTSATDIARYISKSGGSFINSEVEAGLSAASGVAVNPHVALVFEGVNLKNFSMSWSFAPSSRKEMSDITSVIHGLKRAMHPEYKNGGESSIARGLFDYPDMVQLEWKGLSVEDYFVFKPAMINSVSVDYSPQGNALISDGGPAVPAFVNLSVGFVEAEIWTKDDF